MTNLNPRHCERSEAIQRHETHGLLRRCTPRNDESMARKLYAVLTRMAQLRNASATCGLADCRRARSRVGIERRCVRKLPNRAFTLAQDDEPQWRDLLRQRKQGLAAIKGAANVARPVAK